MPELLTTESAAERSPTRVVVGRPDLMELKPHPINPDWIIAGTPVAQSAAHSENFDGWAGTGVWECSAGRFHWHFGWEETLMILDGEVHVTDDHGVTSVLRTGDVGYFPAGSHFVWDVPTYVRKIVFYRQEVPPWIRRVYDVKAILRRIIRR